MLGFVGGLFGSAFGLLFMFFTLMSLPLNVLAVMHLTGWSWFGALVGAILFSCIPVVGQIGYFILAIMGAYFFWAASFDWQKAASPEAGTFSVATLSPSELERFKTDVVRPGFEKACKQDALKNSGFEGKLPERMANLCECYAKAFVANVTRDALIAYEKTGQYPAELQQTLGNEVRRACVTN